MTLWPFQGNNEGIDYPPDMEVYALRADTISDTAYLSEVEAQEHHWYHDELPDPELVKMTVLDYLKANWEEVHPTSWYDTAGRYNFYIQWCKKHKVPLKRFVGLKEAGSGRAPKRKRESIGATGDSS